MAETVFRGPGYVGGSLLDGRIEQIDGPSITYQADTFPDVRFWPTKKDSLNPGRVPAFLNSPYVVVCDNIPQASSTSAIATGANQTASTPMVFTGGASAQANGTTAGNPTMAPGVPLVPLVQGSNGAFNYTGAAVNVLALDFGFQTGTTTSGSANVTVNDATKFYLGQWVCVGGAGNSGKTLPLVAQVTGINLGTNVITLSGGSLNGVAAASVTNAPIGSMNLPGPLPSGPVSGPNVYLPNSVYPYYVGGLGSMLNPPEAITRCVSITGVVGGVGGATNAFTVNGYDIFGQKLTQTLNGPVGATSVFTTKAFKYIASIVPVVGFTDTTHAYSAGISDVYGFNVRSDKWEYTQIFWNGAFSTSSTGWTAAVTTSPATAATGDVRGTIQTNTNSGPGTGIGTVASNGSTVRLMLALTVPLWNDLFGTPQNAAPILGVSQF